MEPLGTTTYVWDARDRLVEVDSGAGVSRYGYDASNLRVSVHEGMEASRILLDGLEELAEYTGGAEVIRYDHDPSGVDAVLGHSTGTTSATFVTDAFGSVYAVVAASGAIVSSYKYDAYGTRTVVDAQQHTKFGFTGRVHDSGTGGILYYRERYLNPEAARWLSGDPIGMMDGPHRYGYVAANPVLAVDPLGLFRTLVVTGGLTPKEESILGAPFAKLLSEFLKADVEVVRSMRDLQMLAIRLSTAELNVYDQVTFVGHATVCFTGEWSPLCGGPVLNPGRDHREELTAATIAKFAALIGADQVNIAGCGNIGGQEDYRHPSVRENMARAANRTGIRTCYSPEKLNIKYSKTPPRRITRIIGSESGASYTELLSKSCQNPDPI